MDVYKEIDNLSPSAQSEGIYILPKLYRHSTWLSSVQARESLSSLGDIYTIRNFHRGFPEHIKTSVNYAYL